MNIKNPETVRLARELAALTGETLTAAVQAAVAARLDQVRREKEKQSRFERIMAIAKECGPLWEEPYKSMNPDDLLYDEKGLPK